MNGLEIRKRIDANNRKIQKALNKFTLTDEINQLMQENADLRAQCPHEFAGTFCRFCDMPIDFKDDAI